MATLSPMITPLPGAKLYKLTPMHFEFLSVRQNVLKEKGFDKAPLLIDSQILMVDII